jgi:hypothetical protein
MFYSTFFKLYTNYLFIPIYFFIGLIVQIIKTHNDKIDKFLYNDEEYKDNKPYNFIMLDNISDFFKLKKNKNIFIKNFITEEKKYEQEQEQKQNKVKYENILTLRENTLFAVDFYKPIHFIYLDYYLENNSELYTLYKLNTITNDIIIYAPSNINNNNCNRNIVIKEIIFNNYTEIINILEYGNKYGKKDYEGWKNLYYQWIKPIEPSDKNNYLKLIETSLDKKQIEVDGCEYTQIYCMRNLIQKDFFNNLQKLYGDKKSQFMKLSYLITIYRINNNNGNVITIIQ